jgi:hypothetical protein
MEKSSLHWPTAKPVLSLLTEARTVIILHALADVLTPLERSRKLFETSGYKLCELTAELNTLFEELDHLGAAETLQDFGARWMSVLMQQTSELRVQSAFMSWKSDKHVWTIKLGTESYSSSALFTELTEIVSGIREQMASRFPDGERDFAYLLSTCFEFELEFSRIQSLKAQHLDGYGDKEIRELIDKLSAQQATGRQFWCQVPFIEKKRTEEVCDLTSANAFGKHCVHRCLA